MLLSSNEKLRPEACQERLSNIYRNWFLHAAKALKFERSIYMIHPSYSELIEAINTNNEDDDESMVLNSRYSLILATSKRARQLIGGAKPLADNGKGKKPLSIAIDELYHGKVKILPGQHEEEDLREIAGLAPEQPAEEAAAEEATAETVSQESAE